MDKGKQQVRRQQVHRAKRAIIMAAGVGKRMHPITLDTPKPLVSVNGKRMIDTVIDGLSQNGIREIYVVVGYLKEKFEEWKERYPEVTIVENPFYASCNNISSLYAARDYIPESIILDGDQMVYHPEILNPEFERSGYCCRWVEEGTGEWLLQTEKGIVTSCSRTGGQRGWQLYSVSFWSAEDGKRLKRHLELEFEEKKHRDIYWDDGALFCYPKEYQLGIREIKDGDLVEIDSIEELAGLDARYIRERRQR